MVYDSHFVITVDKGLNNSSVPTEQGIYDWIDTGTIWYKWWQMAGRRDRVKFRDAIASKKYISSKINLFHCYSYILLQYFQKLVDIFCNTLSVCEREQWHQPQHQGREKLLINSCWVLAPCWLPALQNITVLIATYHSHALYLHLHYSQVHQETI